MSVSRQYCNPFGGVFAKLHRGHRSSRILLITGVVYARSTVHSMLAGRRHATAWPAEEAFTVRVG